MEDTAKREYRARRALERMGYALRKSRTRNPQRRDFGLYGILDPRQHRWQTANGFDLTLYEVEEWMAARAGLRVEQGATLKEVMAFGGHSTAAAMRYQHAVADLTE